MVHFLEEFEIIVEDYWVNIAYVFDGNFQVNMFTIF